MVWGDDAMPMIRGALSSRRSPWAEYDIAPVLPVADRTVAGTPRGLSKGSADKQGLSIDSICQECGEAGCRHTHTLVRNYALVKQFVQRSHHSLGR